jgi:hypothetical protein
MTLEELCPVKPHFTDTHDAYFLECHIYLLLMIAHIHAINTPGRKVI